MSQQMKKSQSKADVQQYQSDQIISELIKQYLNKKRYFNTLKSFETEDCNQSNLDRDKMIKLFNLKRFDGVNKYSSTPQSTIIQVLIQYLKRRQERQPGNYIMVHFTNTQELKNKEKQNKLNNIRKQIRKNRPNTAKERKLENNFIRKEDGDRTQNLGKKSVNVKRIYDKIRVVGAFKKKNQFSQLICDRQLQRKVKQSSKKDNSAIIIKTEQPKPQQQVKQKQQSIKNASKVSSSFKNISRMSQNSQNSLKSDQEENILDDIDCSNNYKNQDYIENMVDVYAPVEQQINLEQGSTHQIGNKQQQEKKGKQMLRRVSEMIFGEKKDQIDKLLGQAELKNIKSQIVKKSQKQKQINVSNVDLQMLRITDLQSKNISAKKVMDENQDEKDSAALKFKKNKNPVLNTFEIQPEGSKQVDQEKEIKDVVAKKQQSVKNQKSEDKNQNQAISSDTHETIPELKQDSKIIVLKKNQEKLQVASEEKPKLMIIGKRKKKLQEQELDKPKQSSKFKFDENFVDQIYRKPTYSYEKFKFDKIVISEKEIQNVKPEIILQTKINYIEKPTFKPIKKKAQKPLSQPEIQKLKKVIFQSGSPQLPKAWSQGFILSPHQQTPYGLQQLQGGPCGIIASVQCFYLKHYFYCSLAEGKQSSDHFREICLIAAITDILWKVRSNDKILLAVPPKTMSSTKLDISSLLVITFDASNFESTFGNIWNNKHLFIGNSNHGVTILLYSIVLTKTPQIISEQIDSNEHPLIGLHGHCTQQLVNLFLTGFARSNCFDGDKIIDKDYKIKGIPHKSEFGFLTIFQTLKYIEVGQNMKCPIFPIWVISKEFHYHVVFAGHYLIGQDEDAEKFDMVFFDGLHNCADRIRLTVEKWKEEKEVKMKDLPLIQQVMNTKWKNRDYNWNGSLKIL